MLPTPHPPHLPPGHATWGGYYAAARTPRAPGPVSAIRVLVGVQVAVLLVGVVLGLGLAVLSTPSLDDGGETGSWAAGFVVVGLAAAAICAGAAAVVGVPALLLRATGGRPAVVALVLLALVETVTDVTAGVGLVRVLAGPGVAAAVLPAVLVSPGVVIVVLSVHPATRAWARRAWTGRR